MASFYSFKLQHILNGLTFIKKPDAKQNLAKTYTTLIFKACFREQKYNNSDSSLKTNCKEKSVLVILMQQHYIVQSPLIQSFLYVPYPKKDVVTHNKK